MSFLVLLLHLAALVVPLARAEDGVLKVRSNVAEAAVFVDNAPVGAVPLTSYVSVGEHVIRVVADRYDPWVRKVRVDPGKVTDVQANLTPGRGTVEWIGPAGARLQVDGNDRGMLPIRLNDLTPGKHVWRVEAPKMEPAEGNVEFAGGKNLLIDVKLTSSEGVVVIASTPAGAEAWLDGERVGVTPLRLTGIAPGPHGVRLSAEGRATVFRTVDTTDGSRGEVAANLPTGGTVLKLPPLGEGSTVVINDVIAGTGPDLGLSLVEKGRTHVVLTEGEWVAEGTFTFPANGRVTLKVRDRALVQQKPLVERWGFWAAVGGGVVAGTTAGIVAAVASSPEPLPTGDVVVALP